MSWLKDDALRNIKAIFVTLLTSKVLKGWLKVDDYSLFPAGFKDGLKGRVPHFHDNPDYMRGHTVGKMRRYYSSDD